MPKFTYVALFKTPTYDGEQFSHVLKPAKIDFFKDSREFRFLQQLTRVATSPRKGEMQLIKDIVVKTAPDEFHIAIWVQVSQVDSKIGGTSYEADSLIDYTIAKLSAAFRDEMFCNLVYRGPIVDGTAIAQLHMAIAPSMVELTAAKTAQAIEVINAHLSKNRESSLRLHLASKFMARAILLDGAEETFLLHWTILEIYPMRNTTHIQPLKEWIAKRTGRPIPEIESKLGIGRLYGHRCDLVHNGIFIEGPQRHKIGDIVLQLSRESIRDLCGQPYSGDLERLFE